MKNILILGIDSELGKEIAKGFISKGDNIIGTYHTKKPEYKKLKLIQLSLEKRDSILRFLKEIDKINFDVVINTIANKLIFKKFENTHLYEFKNDMEVNLFSFIEILKEIIPKMNKDSNIIFILSEMVVKEVPVGFSSYTISKYALLGLMKYFL